MLIDGLCQLDALRIAPKPLVFALNLQACHLMYKADLSCVVILECVWHAWLGDYQIQIDGRLK